HPLMTTHTFFVSPSNDPAPPPVSTLSLHDALPISSGPRSGRGEGAHRRVLRPAGPGAGGHRAVRRGGGVGIRPTCREPRNRRGRDRKSTRLNSSHVAISYAVFCLKKKTEEHKHEIH